MLLIHHSPPKSNNSLYDDGDLLLLKKYKKKYLLVLMKTAVGFILLKKLLSHMPWVSGVREQETTMKSLSDTSVSRGTDQQKR